MLTLRERGSEAGRPAAGHQIPIVVDALAFAALDRLSKAKGQRVTLYAQQLFDAAFAARVGVATGDSGLEAAVNGRGAAAAAAAIPDGDGGAGLPLPSESQVAALRAALALMGEAPGADARAAGFLDAAARVFAHVQTLHDRLAAAAARRAAGEAELQALRERLVELEAAAPPPAAGDRRRRLAPIEEEVLDLRDTVAEQAETIRQLREALAPAIAFPSAWKLSPKEAVLLAALYASPASHMTRAALVEACADTADPDDPVGIDVIDVRVCHIRRKLPAVTIRTVRGVGYGLTPEGRAEIDRALARPVAAALPAAPLHAIVPQTGPAPMPVPGPLASPLAAAPPALTPETDPDRAVADGSEHAGRPLAVKALRPAEPARAARAALTASGPSRPKLPPSGDGEPCAAAPAADAGGDDAPELSAAQIRTARGLRAANWTYPMIARQLGLPAASADAVKAALRSGR